MRAEVEVNVEPLKFAWKRVAARAEEMQKGPAHTGRPSRHFYSLLRLTTSMPAPDPA